MAAAAATLTAQSISQADRDLKGAIDLHIYTEPDSIARSIDALEAAKLARDRGMRAIVLKHHYDQTAGLAYLARKMYPGIEVVGGVHMNLTVGGLNPRAVEYMTQVTGGYGRFVFMPTNDAEAQVKYSKQNRPFVKVSENGELVSEVKAVIAMIAKHDLILGSGNISAEETLMVFREGQRQGLKRMIATHGMAAPTFLTIDQAKEAAKLGAFIEIVGGNLAGRDAQAKIDRFAEQIRGVGPASVIMSSDLGQKVNALPPEGFAVFIDAMRKKGFTDQELDVMTRRNPAALLGLK
ncbi:MAG: hypothetical protein EHM55_24565 [Acidobacteria bacterium]|nr:MAG: hypothetical protein EHM55_24565 [Acidobacteriota bacterium]